MSKDICVSGSSTSYRERQRREKEWGVALHRAVRVSLTENEALEQREKEVRE